MARIFHYHSTLVKLVERYVSRKQCLLPLTFCLLGKKRIALAVNWNCLLIGTRQDLMYSSKSYVTKATIADEKKLMINNKTLTVCCCNEPNTSGNDTALRAVKLEIEHALYVLVKKSCETKSNVIMGGINYNVRNRR